jgi:hypothetical protein
MSTVNSMRLLMRTMRAKYIANVRKKRCPMDAATLEYFDSVLRRLDGDEGKALSRLC